MEQREFQHPGIQDRINEERLRISGTRRAKSMSEDGDVDGLRTQPNKCKHTVKHYSFTDIDVKRGRRKTNTSLFWKHFL